MVLESKHIDGCEFYSHTDHGFAIEASKLPFTM